MKKLKKQYKKIKKKLSKIKFKKPSIEDIFFAFLISFSLIFSGLLFGIGKQIEKEEFFQEKTEPPSKFEKRVSFMVSNYPIKRMIPFIAKKDKNVAAYMIAIAKKESNWGIYHPTKDGKDCFNYWGYRGEQNQTNSGYSCFRTPEHAVNVIGKRLEELIAQDINTPEKMVVWKCGNDCSSHDPEAVSKWIQDIGYYDEKVKSIL